MTDNECQLLDYVKKVSAPQLLTEMCGEKLFGNDIRGIGKMRIYRLPGEVENILLYYAKKKMGAHIDYKDVYRVAARWSRLRIKTAEEALELVRKECALKH